MVWSYLLFGFVLGMTACVAAPAEQIPVRHLQAPMHQFMIARSDSGNVIANAEFTQTLQGDEVTMRLTYKFQDGSIDDETTTYKQDRTFRLVRNHHVQKGPFFPKPIDFDIEAATGMAITRTEGRNGKVQVDRRHINLPDDLANGFVGTVLLNMTQNTSPTRVAMLVPVAGGRLIQLQITQAGGQTIYLHNRPVKATIFRIHPELGRFVGVIARLLGLQPKDILVYVIEEGDPAVAIVLGQLGGNGPIVSSELQGIGLAK